MAFYEFSVSGHFETDPQSLHFRDGFAVAIDCRQGKRKLITITSPESLTLHDHPTAWRFEQNHSVDSVQADL